MCVEPSVPSTSRHVVEAARATRQGVGEHDVLAADEAVARAPVRERSRTGVAGHRDAAAGSTTAEAATAAATPSRTTS